jgi:hypothetical protein
VPVTIAAADTIVAVRPLQLALGEFAGVADALFGTITAKDTAAVAIAAMLSLLPRGFRIIQSSSPLGVLASTPNLAQDSDDLSPKGGVS